LLQINKNKLMMKIYPKSLKLVIYKMSINS
jgi:hypothetical protein